MRLNFCSSSHTHQKLETEIICEICLNSITKCARLCFLPYENIQQRRKKFILWNRIIKFPKIYLKFCSVALCVRSEGFLSFLKLLRAIFYFEIIIILHTCICMEIDTSVCYRTNNALSQFMQLENNQIIYTYS